MTGGTVQAARAAVARTEGPSSRTSAAVFTTPSPTTARAFACSTTLPWRSVCCSRDGLAASAAVIDLDVHHGNGTAYIFEDDRRVFTFSMHQQHNYPMHKPGGSLDIGLDGRHRRRRVSRAAWTAPAGGLRAHARTSCSISRARIRSRTISRRVALTKAGLPSAIAWCSTRVRARRAGRRAARRRLRAQARRHRRHPQPARDRSDQRQTYGRLEIDDLPFDDQPRGPRRS